MKHFKKQLNIFYAEFQINYSDYLTKNPKFEDTKLNKGLYLIGFFIGYLLFFKLI